MSRSGKRADLTAADSHFAFGENWQDFARSVTEHEIAMAMASMKRLLGGDGIEGCSLLDIGCGSGLHSLAALRMGASRVQATDIDAKSVSTTQGLLERFAPTQEFAVTQTSVFDLDPLTMGTYDVVYSWGVLHHTGDLYWALQKACDMVAGGGRFVLAIYRATWLCALWRLEKRWYSRASPSGQKSARKLYLRWMAFIARRHFDVAEYATEYSRMRGMDLEHDVHDWLGGYPYESMMPKQVDAFMGQAGFKREEFFPVVPRDGRHHGLLGSGCDEYVYRRL